MKKNDVVGKIKVGRFNVEITEDDVLCLLCSAFNGGISYWAILDNAGSEWDTDDDMTLEEKAVDILIRQNKPIVLIDFECDDTRFYLNTKALINGLKIYIESGGKDIVDGKSLDMGQCDSVAADAIFQYAIFGELIYC